jgi:hypothetical protein
MLLALEQVQVLVLEARRRSVQLSMPMDMLAGR